MPSWTQRPSWAGLPAPGRGPKPWPTSWRPWPAWPAFPASPATEGGNLAAIAAALAGSYRVNEGGTAKATNNANPVDVLVVGTGHTVYHCRYTNGTVAGQISFDNGATWEYLAAGPLAWSTESGSPPAKKSKSNAWAAST